MNCEAYGLDCATALKDRLPASAAVELKVSLVLLCFSAHSIDLCTRWFEKEGSNKPPSSTCCLPTTSRRTYEKRRQKRQG
jgi:hypothetical protein